ncbi:MAG TPA: hypothetical protein PLI86_10935 [bacterium]|jgi:hypothetical protein|nr:hypothetical protein [bacterium]
MSREGNDKEARLGTVTVQYKSVVPHEMGGDVRIPPRPFILPQRGGDHQPADAGHARSGLATLAVLALAGGAFWQGMATEAAKFSRFVDASVAVYALVKDTPQGAELKAAYEQLWIAGKIKELKPSASVKASSFDIHAPISADELRTKIAGGEGR